MPANCDGGIICSSSPYGENCSSEQPEVPPPAPMTCEGRRNQPNRRPSRTRLIRAPRTGPCVEEELRATREELARVEKEKLAAQKELKQAAVWGEEMLRKLNGAEQPPSQILTELQQARAEIKTQQIRADAYQESLEAARAALARKAKEKTDIVARHAEAADAEAAKIQELEMALAETQKVVNECKAERSAIEEAEAEKIKILEKELTDAQQVVRECSVDRAAVEEARECASKAEVALQEAREGAKTALDHQAALASQVAAAEEKASKAFQAAKEAQEAKARAEALAIERAAQAETAAAATVAQTLAELETQKKIEEERVTAAQQELEKIRLESQQSKAVAEQVRLEAEAVKVEQDQLIEQLWQETQTARAQMAALEEEHEKMQKAARETKKQEQRVPHLDLSAKVVQKQNEIRKPKDKLGKSPHVHQTKEASSKCPKDSARVRPQAKDSARVSSQVKDGKSLPKEVGRLSPKAKDEKSLKAWQSKSSVSVAMSRFAFIAAFAFVVLAAIGVASLAIVEQSRTEPGASELYKQAVAAHEAGDNTVALRMAHRAFKLDSRLEHSMLLGKVFIAKGLHAEAAKVFARNLDADYRRASDAALRKNML